jgi:hypothetical protein
MTNLDPFRFHGCFLSTTRTCFRKSCKSLSTLTK